MTAGAVVRVDELSLCLRRVTADGVRFEVRPPFAVTAARVPVLPLFEGWLAGGELVLRASGVTDSPFAARLAIAGNPVSEAVPATLGEAGVVTPFSLEITLPARALAAHAGEAFAVDLVVGGRSVRLFRMKVVPLRAQGPAFASLDLRETSDAMLFDAPERRLFDLQSPEEGLWQGTGKWHLRLVGEWARGEGDPYAVDTRPSSIAHRWQRANDGTDLVVESPTRRAGGPRTLAELVFDTSHAELAALPPEGRDVPIDLVVTHALTFGEHAATLVWYAPLPIRVRDPRPHLKAFQRLSAVGIDFGTSATVAALFQRGFRSLLRLGGQTSERPAENPTFVLVEDHERLWAEMSSASIERRFPDLVRVVRASHAARDAMADTPSAVVGELKTLPERVVSLDESPQLRDRERQRDFLLDEARVRMLVRAYAYLLGRAINRPGQDVYLHYWLTHPTKLDERTRKLLEEELRAGLLLSIPQGISADSVTVSMEASEPEAFAAEVCPELAAHPALEPLVSKFGELRFAVFDFGGGTLDVACGRFRPPTEEEQRAVSSSTVIETLQTSGDESLGGDYLTHELTWLTHQHDTHLPEMERLEVPMIRPPTVPANDLANAPHLYKRSLAGRQNRVRFERELGLEQVKFGPDRPPRTIEVLQAARLDGSTVEVRSLGKDVPRLHARLQNHLGERIRDGARLLKSMLASTAWGGAGDWREQGVVILLAGNSSRSAFVEKALAEELGVEGLKVWRPDSTEPFSQVVLWETPARVERGVTIVGVTPKTAVALGALKIANREVHLVRRKRGFGWFLGDLRGFPPKFVALLPMGAKVEEASSDEGWIDFGRWDPQQPLRVAKEYVAGKMTSGDPRLSFVPTGLPAGEVGQLFVRPIGPEEIALRLVRGGERVEGLVNLAKLLR